MSFDQFRTLVNKLFQKESKSALALNFSLVRSAFEFIDIRKDGVIDINEWLRTFSYQEVTFIIILHNSPLWMLIQLKMLQSSKN